jgi:predicted ArsR family transcriptional regulator
MAGLERDGLVRARGEARATGGKPAQVYELAEAGRELFARAYARFLAAALAVLADREGATGARRVLREVGRRVAGTLPEARGDLRARVEAAAAALRSLGGDVDVEASAEGFRLRGHGCPLGAVVTVEPAACLMAESLVAALVGTPVAERCDRRDPPRCLFEVRRAGGGRR